MKKVLVLIRWLYDQGPHSFQYNLLNTFNVWCEIDELILKQTLLWHITVLCLAGQGIMKRECRKIGWAVVISKCSMFKSH